MQLVIFFILEKKNIIFIIKVCMKFGVCQITINFFFHLLTIENVTLF